MFTVNDYKIVFKRVWHKSFNKEGMFRSGRYDTVCEIYVKDLEGPRLTGVAKLHPNDRPDKIVGKKIALRNAMSFGFIDDPRLTMRRPVRTEIWKAFWDWVASWPVYTST